MLRSKRRVARHSGFTLVELLVVLAILGMLAALVGPQVLNQLGGAKSKSAAIQIRDFEQALELYKLQRLLKITNLNGRRFRLGATKLVQYLRPYQSR